LDDIDLLANTPFLIQCYTPLVFKKISLVTAGNMINALLGFVFLWSVANSLSLEDFGKYALFVSILLVLARLTDFGTNSVFVTKSILKKINPAEFIGLKYILFAVALIVGIASLALFDLLSLSLILILAGSLIAYTLNYLLYAFYQKEEMYHYLVLLYTIPAITKAIFAPLLVFKILIPTLTLTTGIFGLSIFSGLILMIFNNPIKDQKIKWNLALLKPAWPAGVSQLLTEMWPAISNAVAKTIEGFSDVGIYALANKVSVVFSLISLSIFSVLLPKNAKRKKQDLKYSFDEIFILAGAILLIGIFGIIASKFVVSRFFGSQFEQSLGLLNILVFAAALSAISAFMENYFFIQEDTKKILTISISKLGIFVVCTTFICNIFYNNHRIFYFCTK
jgi:O-antigen/teichoic acid export membrane protein